MSTALEPSREPADGPQPRTCPRCGHVMGPAQDWCLHCGAAVTTHIASAPAWRGPLVAMLGVLVLALAALVLAFFALADDDPAPGPPVGTPTPTVVAPGATEAGQPGETAPAAPGGTAATPGTWPAGESAWTIVLDSTVSQTAAVRRAERLAAQGIAVGVLRSDDFESLRRGSWIVFAGQYDSARAAARAQRDLTAAPATAFVRRITPR